MRVLVLGGAGFLGHNLLLALSDMPLDIRVFDRPGCILLDRKLIARNIEWHEGDFTNAAQIEKAMQDCDVIFHLVSTTVPKTSNDDPVYDIESNVIASVRMMEAAQRCGVKKIIYASSGGTVYGIPEITPIPETHQTNPICAYGIGKLSIEKYLKLFYVNAGIDYCILRLANPYGKFQSTESIQGAIPVFLDKALRNKQIDIWGDGSIIRDYIYVGDVISAFIAALDTTTEEKIFNLGSGIGVSINELLSNIEQVVNRKLKRKYFEGREFDVPKNVLDISRAKQAFGWVPAIGLMEGISEMLIYMEESHKSQRNI